MDNYILTCFHHGRNVVAGPKFSYKGEVDVFVVAIDKYHYSLFEFLSYAKDLGYSNIEGFYCQHIYGEELVPINSDRELLNFVKDLKDGDELDVFLLHGIDKDIKVVSKSSLLLEGPPVCIDEDDIGSNDVPSTDSDVEIPKDDGSNIDEELRAFRAENRSKKIQKKKAKNREKIVVGEAGVDKGFQDIFRKKKNRYVGRLGGDEEFIDSSNCDSIDSTNLVDEDVVVGADLLRRRRSSKIKFDDDCVVVVFELGMIFNGPKEFRKALGRYAVENRVQIILRPNETHRGFLVVVFDLLSNEVRRCFRHIWSNWSQQWKGEEMRKQFWKCSKASFEVKFKEELDYMSQLGMQGKDIVCDLLHYPRQSWVRSFLKEDCKCDVVENNMCETFKSWILIPRHKSIITMLEDIRRKIMTRTVDMIKFANTWICDFAPMARLILEDNKERARAYKVLLNADVGFEIREGEFRHTVDLRIICALYHVEHESEPYVEHWYKKKTFMKAYSHFIQTISNMKMWPETNSPKIEPPEPKKMPGRPARNRKRGKGEPKKKYEKLSKQGVKITCSKCHQQGHNRRYCKIPDPNEQVPSQGFQLSGHSSQESCQSKSSSQPAPSTSKKSAKCISTKMRLGRASAACEICILPPGQKVSKQDTFIYLRPIPSNFIRSKLKLHVVRLKLLRAVEANKATNAAKIFTRENSYFMMTLGGYNVVRNQILIILVDFVREYMQKTSGVIELQDSNGNKKNVYCIRRKMRMILCKRWSKFVRDIGLVVRDAFVGLKYLQIWFVAAICINPSFNFESQKLLA
ncbi:putative synaptotagmin-5-like [Capsicum annuum]|nr:putative synaptotagmin-5-like [Capsicum annuum]